LPALHPFFFALYPILALLAANFQELAPGEALRSLLLVPGAVLALFLILRLLLRDWHRAGAAATFLVLLAFSYGHVYLKLERIQVAGEVLGRHRYLIPVCLLAALLLFLWLWKARPNLRMATQALNVVGAAAIVMTVLSILTTLARIRSNPAPDSLASMMMNAPPAPPNQAQLPDGY
jgi:hypothetical protein